MFTKSFPICFLFNCIVAFIVLEFFYLFISFTETSVGNNVVTWYATWCHWSWYINTISPSEPFWLNPPIKVFLRLFLITILTLNLIKLLSYPINWGSFRSLQFPLNWALFLPLYFGLVSEYFIMKVYDINNTYSVNMRRKCSV